MNQDKQRMCQLKGPSQIWQEIREEAMAISGMDPVLHQLLRQKILRWKSFPEALAQNLSHLLKDENLTADHLYDLFDEYYTKDASIIDSAIADLQATLDRDPACTMMLEPMLFFKGFQALQCYRLSHALWLDGRNFLAQFIQSLISKVFAVDIHPGAQMGCGILIDHATSLVIGETAIVGNNVSILHGVTLGGTGKESGDRHPKVEDGVLLSAHAQLLGNIRIGMGSKVGAGAVVLRDVQAHTTVAGVPAVRVGVPDCESPALEMKVDFVTDEN